MSNNVVAGNLRKLAATLIMTTAENTETILNEADAAKFLKVSTMTLLRNRNKNAIGFYKIGSRITYSMEKHIQPFLESCHQPAKIIKKVDE